jgi:hypothetical protein
MVTVSSFISSFTPTTSTTSTTKVASSTTASSTASTASSGPTTRDAGTAAGIKLQFAADKPRTADSLREQLRGKMDEVLSGIYKDKDQRAKATDESLKSLAPQIEKAVANKSVTGVEMRVGSLDTKYGSLSSVRGLAVEVGFVKDKKISSADTTVMDYQGKSAGLSASETAAGLAKANYSRTGELPADASAAGSEALQKARSALSKVQQTSDALRSFRNGDSGPLDELRAQLQSGKAGKSTSSTSQSQSQYSDPTAALTSRDPAVRRQMLARMASSYTLFV